ncbi:MAG: ABC transporter permease [Elusimicrobiota bacterium]
MKRNKLRTLISILAVASVAAIVIFARGLMIGFNESMYNFYIDNQTGHVRIVNEEYRLREALIPLDYTIDGFAGRGVTSMIVKIKEEIEEVTHVLPRLNFAAMAGIEGSMVRMAGVGVDFKAEESYGNLPKDIKRGRLPESGNEILAGSGLLKDLNAEVGSGVTMMVSDAYRSMQGRTFKVVGVFTTGIAMIDDNYFYLPLDSAQDLLYLKDEVSELMVFGANRRQAGIIEKKVSALIKSEGEKGRYTVQSWNEVDPIIEMMRQSSGTMDYFYVFFILLGTIILITTMTMIVRERTREIGMMAALGMKKSEIMKVFTLEGVLKGITGSLAGVVVGGLITFYYSIHGIHVDALKDLAGETELLFDPVMYLTFSFENLLVSFLMTAVIVTAACLYPAWQAAKMNPVEALRD